MEGERGARAALVGFHVDLDMIFANRQPGVAGRKAGFLFICPLHRRARRVPADADAGDVPLVGVLDQLRGDASVAHPDFVAVVEGRCAAQREEEHGRHAGLGAPDPARDAAAVVVAEHPGRPATRREGGFVGIYEVAHPLGVPGGGDQV